MVYVCLDIWINTRDVQIIGPGDSSFQMSRSCVFRLLMLCYLIWTMQEFVDATNSNSNSHLVTIPAGLLPSDVIIDSPVIHGGEGGGGGMGNYGGAAEGGGMFVYRSRFENLISFPVLICLER